MEEKALSILNDITDRVKYYARRNMTDWLELGKALTEAKALVPHGSWEDYVLKNAGMSMKMCQNCMKAFQRFGTDNPDIAKLNMTQVISLLSGSDEEIQRISAGGPIEDMSSREIQKAIRAAREEEQQKAREGMEIMAQDKARELARQKEGFERTLKEKLDEARAEQADVMESLRYQLEESREAAETLRKAAEDAEARARDTAQAAIDGARDISLQTNRLETEARRLREELADKDAMIEELQRQYDAIRDEYTEAQRTAARGDAERSGAEILSAEAVGDAVRIFIGQVGRIPYMHGTFAMMDEREKEEYRANVMQVREWAEKSMNALDSVNGIGGIVE